jgi:hypothetical protein
VARLVCLLVWWLGCCAPAGLEARLVCLLVWWLGWCACWSGG